MRMFRIHQDMWMHSCVRTNMSRFSLWTDTKLPFVVFRGMLNAKEGEWGRMGGSLMDLWMKWKMIVCLEQWQRAVVLVFMGRSAPSYSGTVFGGDKISWRRAIHNLRGVDEKLEKCLATWRAFLLLLRLLLCKLSSGLDRTKARWRKNWFPFNHSQA